MRMRRVVLGSLLACLLNLPAAGQERLELTLQDCIEQALANNLEVRIERYGPLFAQLNLDLAYAGYDPTLSLQGSHNYAKQSSTLNEDNQVIFGSESDINSLGGALDGLLPWGMTYTLSGSGSDREGQSDNPLVGDFNDADGSARITLTQPLLRDFWIDGTRLGIRSARNQREQSGLVFSRRVIDIVNRVENAYYDLVAARESLKVQQRALDLANQLLQDNRKRVEVGALAPLDEKQSEAEVAAREADLLAAERTLALAVNTLKNLLTDAYSDWQDVSVEPAEPLSGDPVPLNVQDSWGKGLSLRPDLLQQRLELERQGIQLRYDKNQLFPQLDIFGTYGHNATATEVSGIFAPIEDGDNPNWSYGFRFSFPLTNRRARSNYKATKAQLEQALLSLKLLEQNILVEIDDAVKFARVSQQRVNATRAARGYAQAALEAEQQKLENGKSTSFVVLQLQRDLTAAESSEINALVEYNRALSALARSEGSTLQRRNITLDIPGS